MRLPTFFKKIKCRGSRPGWRPPQRRCSRPFPRGSSVRAVREQCSLSHRTALDQFPYWERESRAECGTVTRAVVGYPPQLQYFLVSPTGRAARSNRSRERTRSIHCRVSGGTRGSYTRPGMAWVESSPGEFRILSLCFCPGFFPFVPPTKLFCNILNCMESVKSNSVYFIPRFIHCRVSRGMQGSYYTLAVEKLEFHE